MKKLIFLIILFANIAYSDELKAITAQEFIAKNPSPERQAIVDFIIHQFDEKTVSQAQLDKLWNNQEVKKKEYLIRIQIIKQKIYADSFDIGSLYFLKLLQYFQELVQHYKINDIDFIIYARDEITPDNKLSEAELETPAFMMSKNLDAQYEKNKLLIPDAHIIQKYWKGLIDKIEAANLVNPWKKKEDKIFWRGATTGSAAEYLYNITNFSKFARLKLVILSKLYPELIDAEFNRYTDFSNDEDGKNLHKIIKILFGDEQKIVQEIDHLKYKYLISVDGNTTAWVRVPWIMLSNSVLLKQESQKIEWFYPVLKPYVHYVPIKNDLTDIFSQLEWMKNHETEVQQISANAQNLVRNNLMPEHIDAHMVIILNEYSKIQQDKQIVATLKSVDDTLSMYALLKSLFVKLGKNFVSWYNTWF